MDFVTLKLIDRQRRFKNKILTYFVLFPLGIFFLGCFRTSRSSLQTIFEQEFGFESYWRIIGIIGLIIVIILYISLSKILPYKRGHIQLSKDKIKISQGLKVSEHQTERLKNFKFLADVPFGGDDRHDFEKASTLKFRDNGKKYDFEICPESKNELEAITPIVKAWKELNPEFIYGYK